MARRRRSKESIEGLVAQFLYLVALMAWFASYGWWKSSPWLIAVAFISIAVGGFGIFAIIFSIRQAHHEEQQRALKTKNHWQRLSPSGFEKHVADLFRAKGYEAKVSGKTGDGGVDIQLRQNERKAIVQCKRYEKNVGVKVVREFCSVASQNAADEAFLVTSSGYTVEARKWAKKEPIILIDGDELIEWTKLLRFGAYANEMPRPPFLFTARQWTMITVIAICSTGLLGLVIDLSLQGPVYAMLMNLAAH
jgi:restriction system protein